MILMGLIDIIGTIAGVIFIVNGYVTLGVMISVNCIFFILTLGIMTYYLPQADDVDELKYKMINLQSKLDYIINRGYEGSIER